MTPPRLLSSLGDRQPVVSTPWRLRCEKGKIRFLQVPGHRRVSAMVCVSQPVRPVSLGVFHTQKPNGHVRIGYFVCLLLDKALWMQESTLTICPEHLRRNIAIHTPPPNTCTHNHTKPANTYVHMYLCTRTYTRHTHEYISYIPFWFAFPFYGKDCDQKQLGKEKMYFNV